MNIMLLKEMKTEYSVVVLLAAYNGERYIEQQIYSIINQSDIDDIKILIRDDESSDNTCDILSNIKKRYDFIEVIQGKHVGTAASFHKLLTYAVNTGYDYYSFCDQDDYWFPEKLSAALEKLRTDSASLYSCCSVLTDSELKSYGKETSHKKRSLTVYNTSVQNICPAHNTVITDKLARIILENTPICSDIYSFDLWIVNAAAVAGNIIFDNTPHTYYRQHENNQLKYGRNVFYKILYRIRRLSAHEGCKISAQLAYFCRCFGKYLSDKQQEEFDSFFSNQDNICNRIKYILKTRLYRQNGFETLAFKVLYVLNFYRLPGKQSKENLTE